MKRRRLLTQVALAAALLVGGVASAHLDQPLDASSLGSRVADAASPLHAHDAVVPAARQIRDFGAAQVRGLRTARSGPGARDAAAILAAALVVLALRRRAALATGASGPAHLSASLQLGRGPPAVLAI